jgi:hypothetical protein
MRFAVLALLLVGCYGYPRGGRRAHHVVTAVGIGGGRRSVGGVQSAEMSAVASSSAVVNGGGTRYLSPSGHGGGVQFEVLSGSGSPGLSVKALDAVYAYEYVAGDGLVSLVGFAGPSRTSAKAVNYCYSAPKSLLQCSGPGVHWPEPPDLDDYNGVAWGGVAGLTAGVRLGSLLVGGELTWRATRPSGDTHVGWNQSLSAQLRVGLDIAVAQ